MIVGRVRRKQHGLMSPSYRAARGVWGRGISEKLKVKSEKLRIPALPDVVLCWMHGQVGHEIRGVVG